MMSRRKLFYHPWGMSQESKESLSASERSINSIGFFFSFLSFFLFFLSLSPATTTTPSELSQISLTNFSQPLGHFRLTSLRTYRGLRRHQQSAWEIVKKRHRSSVGNLPPALKGEKSEEEVPAVGYQGTTCHYLLSVLHLLLPIAGGYTSSIV